MSTRVFFSFHYAADSWRAGQVRNIGAVEGNQPASDNDWESITKRGDAAIKAWIDDQLYGRGCTIVLVGMQTSLRPWVDYEIRKSWDDGKKLLGIRINRLLDQYGKMTYPGGNPFDNVYLDNGRCLSEFVTLHDPMGSNSREVYADIARNIESWIDRAGRR